jgi:hypothetical protein
MEDSDSEFEKDVSNGNDDSAMSINPSQVLLSLLKSNSDYTMVEERRIAQEKSDLSGEVRRGTDSVEHIRTVVSAGMEHPVVKCNRKEHFGKGWASNSGKGAREFEGKGSGKRAARKGSGKASVKGAGKGATNEKFQCQFILGIEEDATFRVTKRVLGAGGENMKRIAGESGAKLRLRGRGSKFLEGPEKKESDDDLMLCVSSQDAVGFEMAKRAVSELIEVIYDQYRTFCSKVGHVCPALELKIHEGYRPGSRAGREHR